MLAPEIRKKKKKNKGRKRAIWWAAKTGKDPPLRAICDNNPFIPEDTGEETPGEAVSSQEVGAEAGAAPPAVEEVGAEAGVALPAVQEVGAEAGGASGPGTPVSSTPTAAARRRLRRKSHPENTYWGDR